MTPTNILISSAGRRNYLVQWFREALTRSELEGLIVVADCDPFTPSQVVANEFATLPRVSNVGYVAALIELCRTKDIAFAVSVNDFELSRWATIDPVLLKSSGTRLISLEKHVHEWVEDKRSMALVLSENGISVPLTYLAEEIQESPELTGTLSSSIIIKNRFGSGSSGLVFSSPETLHDDIGRAALSAKDRLGKPVRDRSLALRSLVVQPAIVGTEYGIDVVSDFEKSYATVLVREKLSMRGGETDQATSVDATRFVKLARSLAQAVPHVGLIDVDVIEDRSGERWVIDINPRFGGGYPFSHLAGADVPAAYIAWATGVKPEPSWMTYSSGVTSAKTQSVVMIDGK